MHVHNSLDMQQNQQNGLFHLPHITGGKVWKFNEGIADRMCVCVSASPGGLWEALKLGRVSYCAFSDIKNGLFHTVGGDDTVCVRVEGTEYEKRAALWNWVPWGGGNVEMTSPVSLRLAGLMEEA